MLPIWIFAILVVVVVVFFIVCKFYVHGTQVSNFTSDSSLTIDKPLMFGGMMYSPAPGWSVQGFDRATNETYYFLIRNTANTVPETRVHILAPANSTGGAVINKVYATPGYAMRDIAMNVAGYLGSFYFVDENDDGKVKYMSKLSSSTSAIRPVVSTVGSLPSGKHIKNISTLLGNNNTSFVFALDTEGNIWEGDVMSNTAPDVVTWKSGKALVSGRNIKVFTFADTRTLIYSPDCVKFYIQFMTTNMVASSSSTTSNALSSVPAVDFTVNDPSVYVLMKSRSDKVLALSNGTIETGFLMAG